MDVVARFGYGARGVIYIIIGGLAILAALGEGGRTTDSKGALLTLLGQPFGQALLAIVAAGLLAYALWRMIQSIWDADRHGTDFKGLAVRAALLVSFVTHTLLGIFAINLILGWGAGNGKSSQTWTAWLLSLPFGRWAVGLIGATIIAVGAANMFKGWQAKFKPRLKIDLGKKRWISFICTFGLIARGLVFVIIGLFFIIAALEFSSDEIKGFEGALDVLRQQPYGPWLLAVVAAGLIAFGIYSFIESFFRRIDRSSV